MDTATSQLRWPPPAPGGDPQKRLYFLHVPKTGGIALGAFLRSMYSSDEICPAYHPEDLLAIEPERLTGYRYLVGHHSLLPLTLLPEPPAVITIVREPASHLRSLYRHSRRELGTTRSELWAMPFGEWLRDDATAPLNRNVQARHLTGSLEQVEPWDDDELYERARDVVDRCLWSSTTDRLDESVTSLAAALCWPSPVGLRHANVTTNGSGSLTTIERELAERRSPVDVRLYRHVSSQASGAARMDQQVFERALTDAGGSLDRPLSVRLDHRFWGDGWLPPEGFWLQGDPVGDRAARWLAADKPATIDLPLRLEAADRVDVVIVHAVPTSVPTLELRVNGRSAPKVAEWRAEERIVVSFGVPRNRGGHSRLALCASPDPGEVRRLGSLTREERVVAVERLDLLPPGLASAPDGP